MLRQRIIAASLLVLGILLGWFVYTSQTAGAGFFSKFSFKLGLDLRGGTHLVYRADISKISAVDTSSSLDALRDVIERRVNLFGVSEPVVQVDRGTENRLIVELPGVTDVAQAVSLIGQTPNLEFKTEGTKEDREAFQKKYQELENKQNPTPEELAELNRLGTLVYVDTPLTGRLLKRASLQFDQTTGRPIVALEFNDEGTKLFAEMTKGNVGKTIAIFLDGAPISEPVVQDEITSGRAQITGQFTPKEAKELVGRLNSGALPIPVELISTQKIGASLGDQALGQGIRAGLYGFLVVALFLILWYRLPGLIAVVALTLYIIFSLTIFKFGVVLTSAGIAGFILSIGMAVDANILIFERLKEELIKGLPLERAMHEGFARAWPSIRDSNISSMITATVLFFMGTSLVKGFALTFGIGVLVSMLTAILISRLFLYSLALKDSSTTRFLFSNGFHINASARGGSANPDGGKP